MQFKYEAVTKRGEPQFGTVESNDLIKALEVLHNHNLIVLKINALNTGGLNIKIPFIKKANIKDLVIFSRQLSTLLESKVSLIQALRTLVKQTSKESFKDVIFAMAVAVEGGTAFSGALEMYPDIFSNFYVSIVKSGEASGNLDSTLIYLADHLEKQYDLESKVKGAMTYPALILSVFLIIGFIMMTFVLPKMLSVFSNSTQELPIITRFLIALSAFLTSYWWMVVLAVFGAVILVISFSRTAYGKRKIDMLKLNLPILGPLFQKIYIARFSENLSMLIKGGLPIVQALKISAEVIGNEIYKEIIYKTVDGVKAGEQIGMVLAAYPIIPPIVSNMITIGERTGRIDYVLKNLSKFYTREVDNSVDSLASIIEPFLIVFLGIAVAILVAGVLLPIYNMTGEM